VSVHAGAGTLRVLPIGGCGEVGLNSTLLIDEQDALLIECGILLSLPDAPGVDAAIPDLDALDRDDRKLRGVVITHGHEDHIGAVPWVLEKFDVPVYGPPLALRLLARKLEDKPRLQANLHPIPLGESFDLGPFHIELVRVTHSLPDSAALYIETRRHKILHSGDFKLDPHPKDGRCTDTERLKAIGDAGVDLLLSDSTNSERHGRTRPECDVGTEVMRQVQQVEGRVLVSCFASHLHRLQSIIDAAISTNRQIALLGRAMHSSFSIGHEDGWLRFDPSLLVDEKRIADIPRERLMVLATGSQGEARAALARIALGETKSWHPEPGDRLILSSTTIPGNEKSVRRIVNAMARLGVRVINDRAAAVHCSGHAQAEEQADLLRMVRPRHFVPIHGERAMLEAHVRTAEAAGIDRDRTAIVEDGQSVLLDDGALRRGPTEPAVPVAIDGGARAPIEWSEVTVRRKVGFGGMVMCSAVLDRRLHKLRGHPEVSVRGVPGGASLEPAVANEVANALRVVAGRDDVDRRQTVKSAIRRAIGRSVKVRSVIEIHLLEVEHDH